MSATDAISKIEAIFGFMLPRDYREFLGRWTDDLLEPSLQISLGHVTPGGDNAQVDGLHTADQILANEAQDASCDATAQMLIIGYSLMGGYLYMSYAPSTLGQIYFREPFVASTYYRVADSFSEFQALSYPAVDDLS